MKIQFDSSQPYQQDAVASFVDLFEGQPLNQPDFSNIINAVNQNDSSLFDVELGAIANNIALESDVIFNNLVSIQTRHNLEIISREAFDENGMNFSVEMETGTGKTYVYLRTIFELSQKYGFKKFVIVVPSVAIREGTLKNFEITREHFKDLYNNIECEHFVYDSKKASRLREFATKNILQIMVINIDAFRKDFSDSEDSKKSNVIFKEMDHLLGRKPIEFIQATTPFVIIDEPQSVDSTPKSQEAIKALNPACIFRFSATHKNLYNLVYKLDPVHAFELKLVKQIVVASVTGENAQNNAFMKLLEVDNKKGIKAKIRLQVQGKSSVSEKEIWVKQGDDLFQKSNERAAYQQGFEILEISAENDNAYIDFNSGRLKLGEEKGGIKKDIARIQIERTIRKHLDKELQLKDKGIKVLSLFFVDKVANYRRYDEDGKPQKGHFAELFEQHYNELIQLSQYAELKNHAVENLHDGYFSQDKKGTLKDTNGSTHADDDTYAKIMRNKEQLLSLDEPLKFIFSHSALREGWDNPNVFQICTLNETQSAIKKRQEIGRGLRLPVNQNGERIFDESINKLTIIANESYDDFAAKLQKEYEDDCGVKFDKKHIQNDDAPKKFRKLNQDVFLSDDFKVLWDKIKYKTTYRVNYSTLDLIKNCADAIRKMPKIEPVKVSYREDALNISNQGVNTEMVRSSDFNVEYAGSLPDIVSYLQKQTELTRHALVEILKTSHRIAEFAINPQRFMDEIVKIINQEWHKLMIDGIEYDKLTAGETFWNMTLFEDDNLKPYFQDCIAVKKSVYETVIVDSTIEFDFAKANDLREDVKLFVKLPPWFKIETPIGTYNPDWAIVKQDDEKLYLVRETKGKNFNDKGGRSGESDKVKCGHKHFETLGVDFKVVSESKDI